MNSRNIKADITDQVGNDHASTSRSGSTPVRLACGNDIFIALDKLDDARALVITVKAVPFCAVPIQAKNDSALPAGRAAMPRSTSK